MLPSNEISKLPRQHPFNLKEKTSKNSLTLSNVIKPENILVRFFKPYSFNIVVSWFYQVALHKVGHKSFAPELN